MIPRKAHSTTRAANIVKEIIKVIKRLQLDDKKPSSTTLKANVLLTQIVNESVTIELDRFIRHNYLTFIQFNQ